MSGSELKSYYTNCNRHLLEHVPADLPRVLEFGCSGGMLGKTYKESNSNTIWHGIDIFEEAVDHAKGLIDQAWCLNANELDVQPEMREGQYDALVYGDVIEHLIDPEQSVPKHLELLKSGGKFCVCIPNVQHWSVMTHVFGGNWDYRDSGILDRTHLRFFTRKSFMALVEKLGLKHERMTRVSHENLPNFQRQADRRTRVLNAFEKMCNEIGVEYSNYDFRTFQYVFVAEKP